MELIGLKPFCLRIWLLLVWGACAQLAVAQEFNFKNFNLEDGLGQSVVTSACEDSRGFLWFGTFGGGLNRFDGHDFLIYSREDGLPSNGVADVMQDKDGYLWVACQNAGVARFDGHEFKQYGALQGLKVEEYIDLVQDQFGDIWVQSFPHVFRLVGDRFVRVDSSLGCPKRVTNLYQGLDGSVYATPDSGLYRWNGSRFEEDSMFSNVEIGCLAFTAPDTLILHSGGKLWQAAGDSMELITEAFVGIPNKILRDQRGWIWVAGSFQVAVWQNGEFTPMRNESGLWDVGAEELIEDREGNLWLGTTGGGVSKFLGPSFVHFSKETPLHQNAVFAVEEVKPDVFWVGSERGLFELKNNEISRLTIPQEENSEYVQFIIKGQKGEVYLSTINDTYLYDGNTFRPVTRDTRLNSSITNAISKRKGKPPVLGTSFGYFELANGKASPLKQGDERYQGNAKFFVETASGDEWLIHRFNEVIRLHAGGADTFTVDNQLPAPLIMSTLVDHNDNLWLSTYEGVAVYSQGSFCYLNSRDGLVGNSIFSMIEGADGDIWLGTEKGLNRIQIDEHSHPVSIRTYGSNEGFVGLECNESATLIDHRDRLWFGTIYGLTRYDPSVKDPVLQPPSVYLTDIQIEQQPVDWRERSDLELSWFGLPGKARLSARESSIRFEFMSIAMSSPNRLLYQYILEGLDKDWSAPVAENSVSYPLLPPGEYTFKVKAGYKNGKWSQEPAVFSFYVAAPYYKTWWFRLGSLIAVFLLVLTAVRLRINNIVRQRKKLKTMVEQRTQELSEEKDKVEEANRVKSEFLAKMSHEIRTPMNGVIGMTELLRRSALDSQQKRYVENIYVSGQNLLNLINDILDFSRIESGKLVLEETPLDLRTLIEEVLDILAYASFRKNLELVGFVDPSIRGPVVGDPARIKQILINLVGNALKFTEKGHILVEANLVRTQGEKALVQITVEDSGIGIPKEKFDTLFESFSQVDASTTRKYGGTGLGLAISNQLSQMMGGKMWVESEPGSGSSFHFTIEVGTSGPWKVPGEDHPAGELSGKALWAVMENKALAKILGKYARHWKMDWRTFASSDQLLAEAPQGKPYFALLDCRSLTGKSREQLVSISSRLFSAGTQSAFLCEPGMDNTEQPEVPSQLPSLYKPLKRDQLLSALLLRKNAERSSETHQLDASYGQENPLSILVAEDNPINQEVIGGMLQALGYTAANAENGKQALQACLTQPFDLVLMDVQMPEMDGLEATRQIRKQVPTDQQPTIFAMTANAMEADRKASLSAGMDGFLSKPFLVNELVEVLQSVVEKRPFRDPNQLSPTAIPTQEDNSGAASPEPTDRLTDLSMLMNASGGQTAFVRGVVEKLVDRLPESVAELRQHAEAEEWDQVRSVAHKNKSSSAYTGSGELKDLFKELEHLARERENLAAIPGKLDELEDLVDRVMTELKEALDSLQ